MNKAELVDNISEKTNWTKADSKVALESILEAIREGVASDGKVQMVGFGTFKSVERAARTGRNPKTGEAVEIPAKTVTKFSASF